MFIGHFAPAIFVATRKDAPSLPVLFLAAQLVDWAFFGLLILGIEKARMHPGLTKLFHIDLYYMPYTHSLLAGAIWATGFAALVWFSTRNRTGALLAAAVVLSHWFLDVLVHVPDMTLAGQLPKLGLGLWNHPTIEIPLELGITLGALWFYTRSRMPRMVPVLVLAATFLLLQLFQWFGPVEPEITTGSCLMAFVAFGIFTLLARWVARSESAQ
jgi:hypothetical protein